MTNDELHSLLVRWIAKVTGKTVIKAYQAEDPPAEPYIAVNLLSSLPVRAHEQNFEFTPPDQTHEDPPETGTDGLIYPDVTQIPVIETEWHFSVHAYGGKQATDHLRPLPSAITISQVMEPLYSGIIVHSVSAIRSVPEFVNAAWQQRAQADVFLRGLTRDGFVIDLISDIQPFEFTREG